MTKISIILPAARDQERAQLIVDSLHDTNSCNVCVIVTSPSFSVRRVLNIVDEYAGASRAIARAFSHVNDDSDFVGWLSDICIPRPGCLDRMAEWIGDGPSIEPVIGEFLTRPYEPETRYRVCTINGRQYARWGMMRYATVALIGGFFDPRYVAHYGDVDMSLRCWKAGGVVDTCREAIIDMRGHHHLTDDAKKDADEAVFIERWKDDYPKLVTEHTSVWNRDREAEL